MKKIRANLPMVDENDPQFRRFWDAYPKRVSKKDARHAWTKLQPTPAMVDQMVCALAWQVPCQRWDGDNYQYAPYPASWLNAAKWEDEPPRQLQPARTKTQDVLDHNVDVFAELTGRKRGSDDVARRS